VPDERVHLPGYAGALRQISVLDLGHEEPTPLLTNTFQNGCPTSVTHSAQRMLIENGIAEAVPFFHLDALSSMVGLKVDFDLQNLVGSPLADQPTPLALVWEPTAAPPVCISRSAYVLPPVSHSWSCGNRG
jgi:hypothetical protein